MAAEPMTEPRYFRAREVAKILGLSPDQLRWRAETGELRSIWKNKRRLFPANEVLAKQRVALARDEDLGSRDAAAIEMIQAGNTDAEIIRVLRLPLERIIALRRADRTGAPSTPPPPPPPPVAPAPRSSPRISDEDDERDNQRLRDSYAQRRAVLSDRRRRLLEPAPTPAAPKKRERK